MRVIEVKNYEEMSMLAAEIIGAQVLLKPNCVLGLATGSSPEGTYKELIKKNNSKILDFSQVKTVNLDEYIGLNSDHFQSYRYFMNDKLFDHINIKKENTHTPNGAAEDVQGECQRYEALIDSLGGVDMQLLGIGNNGHIGFNEPDDKFPMAVHDVALQESTIQANSRLFDSIDQVPTRAISMGIGSIMKARRILLIAGPEKREIVERSVYGAVTPAVPASVLQLHRDATVIMCK